MSFFTGEVFYDTQEVRITLKSQNGGQSPSRSQVLKVLKENQNQLSAEEKQDLKRGDQSIGSKKRSKTMKVNRDSVESVVQGINDLVFFLFYFSKYCFQHYNRLQLNSVYIISCFCVRFWNHNSYMYNTLLKNDF